MVLPTGFEPVPRPNLGLMDYKSTMPPQHLRRVLYQYQILHYKMGFQPITSFFL